MGAKKHFLEASREIGKGSSELVVGLKKKIVEPLKRWKETEKIKLPSRRVYFLLTTGKYKEIYSKELYGEYGSKFGIGSDYIADVPYSMTDERKKSFFVIQTIVDRPSINDIAVSYELEAMNTRLILRNSYPQKIECTMYYQAKTLQEDPGSLLTPRNYIFPIFEARFNWTILDEGGLEESVNRFMRLMDDIHGKDKYIVGQMPLNTHPIFYRDKAPKRLEELYRQLYQLVCLDVQNRSNQLRDKAKKLEIKAQSIDNFILK